MIFAFAGDGRLAVLDQAAGLQPDVHFATLDAQQSNLAARRAAAS
jgi:hypothetical protein